MEFHKKCATTDRMDPRYRFVFMVSILSLALWGSHAVWTLFHSTTFSFSLYQLQVALVGGSACAGFALVWAITSIIRWRQAPKTGFEADTHDEFGTLFEMVGTGPGGSMAPYKLSLGKFIPQLIATPADTDLHPLEAELLGFLNGYRTWPTDLAQQDGGNAMVSLYEQSVARWQITRHLPGSHEFHRIAALAKDLAFVHAYQETRKTYTAKQFWKKDTVKWKLRCQPHGGLTAFVLSTFPAFRQLAKTPQGLQQQRALLTALRFHQTPGQLPLNAGPLARDILDYLWRADAQLQQLDVRALDDMTAEQRQSLETEIETHWLSLLGDITPTGSPHSDMTAIKASGNLVWLRLDVLLTNLGPLLSPPLRQQLQLWTIDPHQPAINHPAWSHLATLLQDSGLIANEWEGQGAVNGCFNLQLDGLAWGPAVLLRLDPLKHAPVLREWDKVAPWPGVPELQMDINQLLSRARARAGDVDAHMSEMF
jgi:hypothetical protein